MKNLIFLLSVVLITFTACGQSSAGSGASETVVSEAYIQLSPDAFKAKLAEMPGSQLIDVRTPREFEQGHIEGAQMINYKDRSFKTGIDKLDKSQAVFVYCQAGGRSKSACEIMEKAGFTKIYELEGGYGNWK